MPDILSGKKIVTYAFTEPNADRISRTSHESREGGGKGGCSMEASTSSRDAETADYIIVLAVTEPSAALKSKLTTFIVRRGNPGVVGMTRYRNRVGVGDHLDGFTLETVSFPA